MKKKFLIFYFLIINLFLNAQGDSLTFFQKAEEPVPARITLISATVGGTFVLSALALDQLWYSDYPRSSFHFYNDNPQWLQMDKAGHVFSAYHLGRVGHDLMDWSGVSKRKSIWYGGSLGLLFLTTVEVMDGFSAEWGFSSGDAVANVTGSALFISQQLLWEEQRISLKFSASKSPYAAYRPEVLGNTAAERLFKDYNGQTYWVSVNLKSFFPEAQRIPEWLNVAVGYSADQLLGGSENPQFNIDGVPLPRIKAERQFLFSLDVDLYKIETRKTWLNALIRSFGYVKFPFPAIELSNGKLRRHLLYF